MRLTRQEVHARDTRVARSAVVGAACIATVIEQYQCCRSKVVMLSQFAADCNGMWFDNASRPT